ncbi:MAG: diaminopropionate ammonia-lyase [Eubacteriales bacterium]|nr:diaminopropionate ammonia-lyase [Eubacteriales bacterium]
MAETKEMIWRNAWDEPFRMVLRAPVGANRAMGGEAAPAAFMAPQEIEMVRRFHSSFPGYRPTPLAVMPSTAEALGIGALYVKDESWRFGIDAFKVLGGSYAIGRSLAQRLGLDPKTLTYGAITSPEAAEKLGKLTFVTATDGNHGRGVAWTARRLGQKSVVYMPQGSSLERKQHIADEGAEVTITDLNYDEAVRLARRRAEENGWLMVQDTAWEGYKDIPRWIMQGYGTMALEALEQMPAKPTHIFLQAGVGSMAGAAAGFFAAALGEACPAVIIVEPENAGCLYQTAKADDGRLHFVTGKMETIMAGLACGEPCSFGWNILRRQARAFLTCPDRAAAYGMRILGSPAKEDPRVISGESGAAAFGCAAAILTEPGLAGWRELLGLDRQSRVLVFSTEGATDRAAYRAIVWDGAYPYSPSANR